MLRKKSQNLKMKQSDNYSVSNLDLDELRQIEPFSVFLVSIYSGQRYLYAGLLEDESGIWIKVMEDDNLSFFKYENAKSLFRIERED